MHFRTARILYKIENLRRVLIDIETLAMEQLNMGGRIEHHVLESIANMARAGIKQYKGEHEVKR